MTENERILEERAVAIDMLEKNIEHLKEKHRQKTTTLNPLTKSDTLGTLGIAVGTDYLLSRLPVTEKRDEHIETLQQSVRDIKELGYFSLFFEHLSEKSHRAINGYYTKNNTLKNSVINFIGETTNAFVLRYLRKPITSRLKNSKNPIVETVLKNPLFLYSARLATIRALWRLEKFVINQTIS